MRLVAVLRGLLPISERLGSRISSGESYSISPTLLATEKSYPLRARRGLSSQRWSVIAALFDLGCLAVTITQVVQLGATNVTAGNNFDCLD